MRAALHVIGETVRDWYYSMLGLVSLNALWLALGLTVILLPPATAGMYSVTSSVAHGKGQHFSDFSEGFRRYFWLSLRWGLINLLIGAILFSNVVFYRSLGGLVSVVLRLLVGSLGLLWLVAQLYVWPFIVEQEDKHLRVALKNAVFLTLAAPVYSLTLFLIAVLVIVFSLITVLPIAVFAMGFISLLGHRAVIERLITYGKLGGNNGKTDSLSGESDPGPLDA